MTKRLLGIDEVGRGPWAGPLVVGAVILGENFQKLAEYNDLRDSKKIAKKKREKLAKIIQENALSYGLGWVSAKEIDHFGLGRALKLAARRAVKQILQQKVKFDNIVIDGTINLLTGTPLENQVSLLPKADNLVKEVSAASIIAKVARDQYMTDLATKYPEYGFESHVGYGTAKHRQALKEHGICPEHRQSFQPIAKIIEGKAQARKSNKNINNHVDPQAPHSEIAKIESTKAVLGRKNQKSGHFAENSVANYLSQKGHQIIAQNYKTKTYEIDLISIVNDKIYFTEVKYRQNPSQDGDPLEMITGEKQHQMRFACEKFLSEHQDYQELQPLLAVASVSGEDFEVKDWFTL